MATSLPAWNPKQGHEPRVVTTIPFDSKTTASWCARIPLFNLTYQPYIAVLWKCMCMIQQIECRIFCYHPHPSQDAIIPWFLSLMNSSKTANKLLVWWKLITWKLVFHYFQCIRLWFLPRVKKFHQNIWSSPYNYLSMNKMPWMLKCCI